MMPYGSRIDQVVGGLSRLLHVRPARHNTVEALARHYLDLPAAQMFPAPPPIADVRVRRSVLDRAIRSSTLEWTSSHEPLCPDYRRRHRGPYRKNLTAYARWLRPEGRRRDTCLVYVHGWLEPGSWAEETTLFRKWAKDLDVDLVHVSLPFHGKRKPRSALFSGELFWTADLVRSIEGARQAVCDTRAVVAYMREQGYRRVGVTGISLGGAIAMIVACLSPAPDFVVPIVAHVQLDDAIEEASILWRMKRDLEKWGVREPRRRELFRRLGFPTYEPVVPPDRQLWIQAQDDTYINAERVREQWERWGRPGILWIEGGHMTFPLFVARFTDAMREFLSGWR